MFYVIDCLSVQQVMDSSKHGMWSSDWETNRRLDEVYKAATEKGIVVCLIYKHFGSRCFCGVAKMRSRVDFERRSGAWRFDRTVRGLKNMGWCGEFHVKWMFLKDLPEDRLVELIGGNSNPIAPLIHGKEIPTFLGFEILRVFNSTRSSSTLMDGFKRSR